MFGRVLALELRKVAIDRSTWLGVGAVVLLSCGFYAMFYAFRGNIPASGTRFLHWPLSLVYALGNAAGYTSWTSYGTFLLIVLVGAGLGREYAWGTLQLWLAHGVSRRTILAARLAVAAVAALVIAAVCLVFVGALSVLLASGAGSGDRLAPLQLLLAYLRTSAAMVPYAALALLLAVRTRSAAAAVGGAMAALLVLETALVNVLPALGPVPRRVAAYLPSALATALNAPDARLAGGAIAGPAGHPSPLAAAGVLALYSIVFVAAAVRAFDRQDLARS